MRHPQDQSVHPTQTLKLYGDGRFPLAVKTGKVQQLGTIFWLLVLMGLGTAAQGAVLKIVHIDVGQGDATLFIGPTRSLLFDSGKTGSGTALKAAIQSAGLGAIDYFVAGHYHEDHIGGIDELIKAGIPLNVAAYDRGGKYSSTAYSDYTKAVGTKRKTMQLGQQLDLGGGVLATCIAVNGYTHQGSIVSSDENSKSIALVIHFDSFDYVITSDLTGGGDGTPDMESLLAEEVGNVDVVHVGHHGSATSTNQAWVDALEPEHAVISCGNDNSYGHPTQGVLTRLESSPTLERIWQTEQCSGGTSSSVRVGGTITFTTTGDSMTVSLSRTGESFSYATDGGILQSSVVINEIAWMGSLGSSYDEWIELYNSSDSTVTLDGWKIMDDNGAQIYTLSGSVAAKSYYLIERSETATSVRADVIVGAVSLANTGDSLILMNASGWQVDGVNLSGGSWWDGDNTTKQTMERVDPLGNGNDLMNWLTNDGSLKNGTDSKGNPIQGTPRSVNSASF